MPDSSGVAMSVSKGQPHDPYDPRAEAMRRTREFQAGAAFGVPEDASEQYLAGLLAAADEADRVARIRRMDWGAFTARIDMGDDRTEPAATPDDLVSIWDDVAAVVKDHDECCAVWCDECATWERWRSCEKCSGGGCLPNPELAYLECDECAGDGRAHRGYTAEIRSEALRVLTGGDEGALVERIVGALAASKFSSSDRERALAVLAVLKEQPND